MLAALNWCANLVPLSPTLIKSDLFIFRHFWHQMKIVNEKLAHYNEIN